MPYASISRLQSLALSLVLWLPACAQALPRATISARVLLDHGTFRNVSWEYEGRRWELRLSKNGHALSILDPSRKRLECTQYDPLRMSDGPELPMPSAPLSSFRSWGLGHVQVYEHETFRIFKLSWTLLSTAGGRQITLILEDKPSGAWFPITTWADYIQAPVPTSPTSIRLEVGLVGGKWTFAAQTWHFQVSATGWTFLPSRLETTTRTFATDDESPTLAPAKHPGT